MNYKHSLRGYTKKLILAVCLWTPCLLLGNEHILDENLSSEKYFNEKQYKKALPLLEDEAIRGLKPSIYRLAHMYKNGLGVKIDNKKAAFWFEQAASEYSYTLVMETEKAKEKNRLLRV